MLDQLHVAIAGGYIRRALESFDGNIAAPGGDIRGCAFGQLDGQIGAAVGPSLDLHQNVAAVDGYLWIERRKRTVRVAVRIRTHHLVSMNVQQVIARTGYGDVAARVLHLHRSGGGNRDVAVGVMVVFLTHEACPVANVRTVRCPSGATSHPHDAPSRRFPAG